MTNIVNFPKKEKRSKPLPRQRVFYIGYWYVGPVLCQEVQRLYLKRKGLKNGTRYWSVLPMASMMRVITGHIQLKLSSVRKTMFQTCLNHLI